MTKLFLNSTKLIDLKVFKQNKSDVRLCSLNSAIGITGIMAISALSYSIYTGNFRFDQMRFDQVNRGFLELAISGAGLLALGLLMKKRSNPKTD